MITIHRTVTTTTAPDRVHAYLADFSTAAEWDSGTQSCERISGDGGVGTRYRNVSTFAGRSVELTYTLTELTPTRIVLVGRNATTTSTDTIDVSPRGSGSTIDYRAEFTFSGPARFLQPLLKPLFGRLGDKTAQTLTTALDRL